MTDVRIAIVPTRLSDGSVAHDVTIGWSDLGKEAVRLPATSERDAHELAETLRHAIDQRTTASVYVVEVPG